MFGKGGGGDWLSVSVKKLNHDIIHSLEKNILRRMTCNEGPIKALMNRIDVKFGKFLLSQRLEIM